MKKVLLGLALFIEFIMICSALCFGFVICSFGIISCNEDVLQGNLPDEDFSHKSLQEKLMNKHWITYYIKPFCEADTLINYRESTIRFTPTETHQQKGYITQDHQILHSATKHCLVEYISDEQIVIRDCEVKYLTPPFLWDTPGSVLVKLNNIDTVEIFVYADEDRIRFGGITYTIVD